MAEYEIEFYWKEQTVYWEGDRGFVFDGAWGAEPIATFVPDAAGWEYLPEWLRHRRDLVLQRLRDCPDHVVVEDPDYTDAWRRGQRHNTAGEVTRDQVEARFRIADMGTNRKLAGAMTPGLAGSPRTPTDPVDI